MARSDDLIGESGYRSTLDPSDQMDIYWSNDLSNFTQVLACIDLLSPRAHHHHVFERVQLASRRVQNVSQGPYAASEYPLQTSAVLHSEYLDLITQVGEPTSPS